MTSEDLERIAKAVNPPVNDWQRKIAALWEPRELAFPNWLTLEMIETMFFGDGLKTIIMEPPRQHGPPADLMIIDDLPDKEWFSEPLIDPEAWNSEPTTDTPSFEYVCGRKGCNDEVLPRNRQERRHPFCEEHKPCST